MKNKYPIFIPSKGRSYLLYTMKTFDEMNVDYTVVVEPQEYDDYRKVLPNKDILVTPHRDKGLTTTRNFIWNHAEKMGYKRFWTFDDNIRYIYRLHNNTRIRVGDGTCLRVIEDFADRYENLHLTGMQYRFFVPSSQKRPPYTMNTRVYSNMLLRTDARDLNGDKFRNNLFYNDDTDLCLRMLKNGFPIIQFNAFLIGKEATMVCKGGMTEYYQSDECEGRKKFAEELINAHPDVARLTWKFNRWHHEVDYSPFKKNKLIRIKNYDKIVKKGINNYGMKLIKIKKD